MPQTRRAMTRALLPGLLATASLLRPQPAAAQTWRPAAADLRARFLEAQNAMAVAPARLRLAAERSLARLDDLAIDTTMPRLILVNIAAGEVIALDAGREVMRSRAVVGTGRTRTPQLLTFATSVRTNPPWHVPASIVAEIRAAGRSASRRWATG